MRSRAIAALLLAFTTVVAARARTHLETPPPPAAEGRIAVGVDPRVELMCIIFRLAGSPEYNQPNSQSPYADAVEDRFGRFRDHPVVAKATSLRGDRGVSYDAVMSMAVHVEDTVTLRERIPFDERPARLDTRWTVDEARRFLVLARDFVDKSDFNGFIGEQRAYYDGAAARLREVVDAQPYLEWFDAFFGARAEARFRAIPGLLTGGGSYGVGIRFGDGREEITPVIGAWRFDEQGLPRWGTGSAGTIVHEFCHSYTNPVVDRHAEALAPAGRRIYPLRAAVMRRQAYGNWKAMMYESLVRACTVRYVAAHGGRDAAEREIDAHRERGFDWTGALAEILGEYESDRVQYAELDAFMPRVVAFFEDYAEGLTAQAARAPRVRSIVPANGAVDVDPGLTAIVITFDRPMLGGSWSVVGGGPEFPELAGAPAYDAARRVLTLPVVLKPGWTYRLALNSERYSGFRSADGVALAPVTVTFTTRDE